MAQNNSSQNVFCWNIFKGILGQKKNSSDTCTGSLPLSLPPAVSIFIKNISFQTSFQDTHKHNNPVSGRHYENNWNWSLALDTDIEPARQLSAGMNCKFEGHSMEGRLTKGIPPQTWCWQENSSAGSYKNKLAYNSIHKLWHTLAKIKENVSQSKLMHSQLTMGSAVRM